MPQKIIDISGQKFGRLTAIRRSGRRASKGEVAWLCDCECGKQTVVRGSRLRRGDTKTCGGKGRSCKRFETEDITGNKYGRLTAIKRNGFSVYSGQRLERWDCVCECGQKKNVLGYSLKRGATRSCGCLGREALRHGKIKHGRAKTLEYRIFHGAKSRAKKFGVEFNIDLDDISVPAVCPMLGIKIAQGVKAICKSSPTLDKIIPSLGYVKGNVWVISQRANQIKSDLSLEDLKMMVRGLEKKINESDALRKGQA